MRADMEESMTTSTREVTGANRAPWTVVCVILALAFFAMIQGSETPQSTVMRDLAEAGITCPNCLVYPENIARVHTFKFVRAKAELPTIQYLEHLTKLCQGRPNTINKRECERNLEQAKIGEADLSQYFNPLYGRTENSFTQAEIEYISAMHRRLHRYLNTVERMVLETELLRFQRERYRHKT